MECKAVQSDIGRTADRGIDLTRMECKGYLEVMDTGQALSIDLTRMECKVIKGIQNSNKKTV